MSRKKTILSIFLLILLVIVGIVLPTIWKHQNQQPETEKDTDVSDGRDLSEKQSSDELEFLDFEKLSDFFPDKQIMDLKEQIPTYIEETKETDVKSITFLPDETTYPDKQTTNLVFQPSNGHAFSVTYSASNGVFLFGEEKLQISKDTQAYEKETDHSLPSITTEEIEALQEGGFSDNKAVTTQPSASEKTLKPEETSGSGEVPQ